MRAELGVADVRRVLGRDTHLAARRFPQQVQQAASLLVTGVAGAHHCARPAPLHQRMLNWIRSVRPG